jgi:hypothetical protein
MFKNPIPTRRELFSIAAAVFPIVPEAPLVVPVRHLVDKRAKLTPEQTRLFWSRTWPEAVRDLGRCGIRLQCSLKEAEIRRSPGGLPIFAGLERGVINFVITDQVPLEWDSGRGLSGVTTLYRGYHLCMAALNYAHGHQVPFLSVNTCMHELLHALLHDIFEGRPSGFLGAAREFRIDLYATRLWLFHDGIMIRKGSEAYVQRLRSGSGPQL